MIVNSRANATHSKTGAPLYHRKYSKRSGNFSVHNVKVKKHYPHVPQLMANILHRRKQDDAPSAKRKFSRPEKDPKLLSPNIGMKEAPLTTELVTSMKSRFS